jgi:A/G-specific adenine glycosylase
MSTRRMNILVRPLVPSRTDKSILQDSIVPAPFLSERQGRAWLRRRLSAWFTRHARKLPWRTSRDPYAIWISEVMLQQTQVATVIPFFERFVRSFPRVAALAQADLHEVLCHWEGLGYYRRARDLHRTARIIDAEHHGSIPDSPELLRSMPGLGPYTVGAILSQAFDRRVPILEANSLRVLCRLLGVQEDPRKGTVRRALWNAAATLLPVKEVGQFNQAMMELGALVCTPTSPECPACPLARHCWARLNNLQEKVPFRAKEAAPVPVREVALVLRRGSEVLLAQRPLAGRWASLWEFPHTALAPDETHAEAGSRLLAELGLEADLGDNIITLKHAVTRFRITLVCLEARYRRGRCRTAFYAQSKWLSPTQLHRFPVSSPQRRLAAVVDGRGQRSGDRRQKLTDS